MTTYSTQGRATRGYADDAVIETTLSWGGSDRRIIRHRDPSQHHAPSIRRRIRAGDKDQFYRGPVGPARRLFAAACERIGAHWDGSVIPYRNPTAAEAWVAIDDWLRTRYRMRMVDVVITDTKGTWIAKELCDGRSCGGFTCTPYYGIRHTYHLDQSKPSYLTEWGDYAGGGWHQDARGRRLSPFRSWRVLFADAERRGDPIARYDEKRHGWFTGEAAA